MSIAWQFTTRHDGIRIRNVTMTATARTIGGDLKLPVILDQALRGATRNACVATVVLATTIPTNNGMIARSTTVTAQTTAQDVQTTESALP